MREMNANVNGERVLEQQYKNIMNTTWNYTVTAQLENTHLLWMGVTLTGLIPDVQQTLVVGSAVILNGKLRHDVYIYFLYLFAFTSFKALWS